MTSPVCWVAAGSIALLIAAPVSAQSVPGVTGTVALEGTVEQEYGTANALTVKTVDGVKHVFKATKGLLVHGGKRGGDALADLREGTTVVVHYTVDHGTKSAQEIDRVGDDGLQVTEGVVTSIDRRWKEIRVKFDNGTTEVFRLTDNAASEAGKPTATPDGTRVVIYYTDESGHKVAHFFKKAS